MLLLLLLLFCVLICWFYFLLRQNYSVFGVFGAASLLIMFKSITGYGYTMVFGVLMLWCYFKWIICLSVFVFQTIFSVFALTSKMNYFVNTIIWFNGAQYFRHLILLSYYYFLNCTGWVFFFLACFFSYSLRCADILNSRHISNFSVCYWHWCTLLLLSLSPSVCVVYTVELALRALVATIQCEIKHLSSARRGR